MIAATSGRPPIIIGVTIGFLARRRATAPAGGGSPAACEPVSGLQGDMTPGFDPGSLLWALFSARDPWKFRLSTN
jgi:hypothetical protein